MFFEDFSTKKLGIAYGGEERPAEGPLSEKEKAARNRRHREEVQRAFDTLDRLWGTTLDNEWWVGR